MRIEDQVIYLLVLAVKEQIKLRIRRIGILRIQEGLCAYVGSVLGKGGSALRRRIGRHLKKDKKLKWHIDYLTSNKSVKVVCIISLKTKMYVRMSSITSD